MNGAAKVHGVPLAECHDCRDPIRFVQLDTGRPLPVDPIPNDRGNVAAKRIGRQLHGHVVTGRDPAGRDEVLFMPHAAACPERPPRIAQPKRDPDPTLFD